jgi:hypothetical protein
VFSSEEWKGDGLEILLRKNEEQTEKKRRKQRWHLTVPKK